MNNTTSEQFSDGLFRIKINRQVYEVPNSHYTGRLLLELAGLTPVEDYAIYQKMADHSSKKIEYDEVVDLSIPGVERFYTMKLNLTEGFESLRSMFSLIEDDHEFLKVNGYKYETVSENRINRLIIYNFIIPSGYNVETASLFLRIEQNYPDTEIDMFYLNPHLQRIDGKSIKALTYEDFDGKSWQRWSRHRSGDNRWRPEIDCVRTHIELIYEVLNLELRK